MSSKFLKKVSENLINLCKRYVHFQIRDVIASDHLNILQFIEYYLRYAFVFCIYLIATFVHTVVFIPMKFYTRHYAMIKVDEELRKYDSNLDGKIFVVTGCSNGKIC